PKCLRFVEFKKTCKLCRSLIGLKEISYSESSTGNQYSKGKSQNFSKGFHSFFFQTFFKIIHRPSINGSIFANIAILNSQCTFSKLCCHSQKPSKNHPKRSARSSD